ncbi:hypothetical protein ANRL1_02980 [Anaerolineae bacterium]|nr:hypothetical protein ANRL1_02980 [Anaerolineae bacterium]
MEQNLILLAPATFLAGLLSFLSPCTLPILPAYFAFTFQANRQTVVRMTVAFFLGLATTMILLGASATLVSRLLAQNLRAVTLIGGLLIVAFGVMSLFGKGFTGIRFQQRPNATAFGSYLYGATFALGWTTCIGPLLGAGLTLLATQGIGVLEGMFLAFVYTLGLGAPLILISVYFSRLGSGTRVWQFLRGKGFDISIGGKKIFLHTTSILSGVMMIALGLLLASGQLSVLTQTAQASDLSQWVIATEEKIQSVFGLK